MTHIERDQLQQTVMSPLQWTPTPMMVKHLYSIKLNLLLKA